MLQFLQSIAFLILCFTHVIRMDTHQFNRNYHQDPISSNLDKIDQYDDTSNDDSLTMSDKHVLNEHIKVIIIIGCISVGLMTLIFAVYLIKIYFSRRTRRKRFTREQDIPFNIEQ